MKGKSWFGLLLSLCFILLLGAQNLPDQFQHNFGTSVTVVNMIPLKMSDESHQDSEPSLAVNPANVLQIAGGAFTPDSDDDRARSAMLRFDDRVSGETNGIPPWTGENVEAPIYVTTDGGLHWRLNPIVPFGNPYTGTRDITLAFGKSGVLYVGALRGDSTFDGTTCPQQPRG